MIELTPLLIYTISLISRAISFLLLCIHLVRINLLLSDEFIQAVYLLKDGLFLVIVVTDVLFNGAFDITYLFLIIKPWIRVLSYFLNLLFAHFTSFEVKDLLCLVHKLSFVLVQLSLVYQAFVEEVLKLVVDCGFNVFEVAQTLSLHFEML